MPDPQPALCVRPWVEAPVFLVPEAGLAAHPEPRHPAWHPLRVAQPWGNWPPGSAMLVTAHLIKHVDRALNDPGGGRTRGWGRRTSAGCARGLVRVDGAGNRLGWRSVGWGVNPPFACGLGSGKPPGLRTGRRVRPGPTMNGHRRAPPRRPNGVTPWHVQPGPPGNEGGPPAGPGSAASDRDVGRVVAEGARTNPLAPVACPCRFRVQRGRRPPDP